MTDFFDTFSSELLAPTGLASLPKGPLTTGIYDIPVEHYHLDPAPEPSLSSSLITTLLDKTPAHAKAQHPKLTDWPELTRESTDAQDLGTVVHKLVLGKGGDFKVITGFDDWRKKEAQALRDEARGNGYVPLLERKAEEAAVIAHHAINGLKQRFGTWPIGESEQTMIWKRATGIEEMPEVWCRGLADHLSRRAQTIVDIKTTALGLHDGAIINALTNKAAIQAAFYRGGIERITGEYPNKWQFIDFFVETQPPYLVRSITVTGTWIDLADQRIDKAAATFARCLATGEWPSWPTDSVLEMPAWVQSRWGIELDDEITIDVEEIA